MQRRPFLSLLCAAAFACAQAQQGTPLPRTGTGTLFERTTTSARMSPHTALLINELQRRAEHDDRALSDEALAARFGLRDHNGTYLVNAFVMLANGASTKDLERFGKTHTGSNGIATLSVRVDDVVHLASAPSVAYLQIAEPVHAAMDNARAQCGVDLAHAGTGLPQAFTGAGVVVGVIDIGFDYSHPTFYNESGTTYRVARVWEQSNSGTPPAGFSYGRELVGQNAILAVQHDATGESHATHVTGIAAGSGPIGGTFRGVAPGAELVLVSSDLNTVSVADGIAYIMDHAESVGKPCVINMSLGAHVGPHDGNSPFDLYCEGIAGPGRLLVGAAGNEGSDRIHVQKAFAANDTILYTAVKFPNSPYTMGSSTVDIWGSPGHEYWVAVNVFNSSTGQIVDWTPYVAASSGSTNTLTLNDTDPFDPDPMYVSIVTSTYPRNNKHNVQIHVDHTGQDDTDHWILIEVVGFGGEVNLWEASGRAEFNDATVGAPVVGGNSGSTIGEIGGTGRSILSVGAFTSKGAYTNFMGGIGTVSFPGVQGGIASFSSKGPTTDGRTKPDITAPGNVVVSAVNSYNPWYSGNNPYVVDGLNDGSQVWWYAAMQGTSMAAPFATGVLALWLEADPMLTPEEAIALAKQTARTDGHTGTIAPGGHTTWGWGKIDAHAGLVALLNSTGVDDPHAALNEVTVFPNPSTGEINVRMPQTAFMNTAEVYDMNGTLVHSVHLGTVLGGEHTRLDLHHLAEGLYLLKLHSEAGSSVHRVSIVH